MEIYMFPILCYLVYIKSLNNIDDKTKELIDNVIFIISVHLTIS